MNVEKLTRLFGAIQNTSLQPKEQSTETTTENSSNEAVTLGHGFETVSAESQRDKVERLKAEVRSGSYRPDTRLVAEAVARELLT